MTPEGNQKAQEYYRKALEKDAGYALVYSILGSNFGFAGLMGFIPPDLAAKHALENTEKALKIDPSISVAHSTLGALSLVYDWDLKAAEEGFLKSVELNPNSAWDRFFYTMYLRSTHQYDRAIAESSFVLEKDPFNIYICTEIGVTFLLAGRIEEAIERQKYTIDIYPEGFMAHLNMGEALEVKRNLEQAIEYYDKAAILSQGNPLSETRLACALVKAGNLPEAKEKIQRVEKAKQKGYVPASSLIPYYLLQKDFDRAFHWFQQACKERDFNLPGYINTPIPEHRLPDDPRFNALLESTGLIKYLNGG